MSGLQSVHKAPLQPTQRGFVDKLNSAPMEPNYFCISIRLFHMRVTSALPSVGVYDSGNIGENFSGYVCTLSLRQSKSVQWTKLEYLRLTRGEIGMQSETTTAITAVKQDVRLREWAEQLEAQQASGLTVPQ